MTTPMQPQASKRELRQKLRGRPLALFLDYDGTLTPIVDDPAAATLAPGMREVLRQLATQYTVALVSGRDLHTLRNFVQLDNVYYAGSHGFDIAGPNGLEKRNREGEACLEDLGRANAEIEAVVRGIKGCEIERKAFATAVHYRNAPETEAENIARMIGKIVARYPKLQTGGGKKVIEVRPAVDWDKGRAVLWLLQVLNLDDRRTIPIYIGDDLTDEDAFAALSGRGIAIYVGQLDRPTAAGYRLEDVRQVREFLESLLR